MVLAKKPPPRKKNWPPANARIAKFRSQGYCQWHRAKKAGCRMEPPGWPQSPRRCGARACASLWRCVLSHMFDLNESILNPFQISARLLSKIFSKIFEHLAPKMLDTQRRYPRSRHPHQCIAGCMTWDAHAMPTLKGCQLNFSKGKFDNGRGLCPKCRPLPIMQLTPKH